MIHYRQGIAQLSYNDVALIHWETINPKTKAGTYYKRESLIGRIEGLKEKYRMKNLRKYKFYDFLLSSNGQFLKTLIVSDPLTLDHLSRIIKRKLIQLRLNYPKFLKELLDDVFQYDNWRSNGKFETLFGHMDINICPYCNHQDVFRDDASGLMIVSVDHYIDKAKHPCLSLSFYNLVPVCYICNVTYKQSKTFRTGTHIHPYLHDYNLLCKFNNDYIEGMANHNIFLETNDARCKKSTAVLGIMSRYAQQSVKAISKTMYYHGVDYSPSKKLELVKDWNLMTIKQVEDKICKRFDIPESESMIRNISLGKLKRDLALKYKIIT